MFVIVMKQADIFRFDFKQSIQKSAPRQGRTNAKLELCEQEQEAAELRFYESKSRFKGKTMPDEMIGDFRQLSHILHCAKHQDDSENKDFPMHFVIAVDRIYRLWVIRRLEWHEIPLEIIMTFLHRSIDVFEARCGQPVRHLIAFTQTKIQRGRAKFL